MSKADEFIESMKDEAGWTLEDLIAMGRLEPFTPPTLFLDVSLFDPANRAELIRTLWEHISVGAPEGFLQVHEGGPVLGVPDPTRDGYRIIYEKIGYSDRYVIEAEGVVVCHL